MLGHACYHKQQNFGVAKVWQNHIAISLATKVKQILFKISANIRLNKISDELRKLDKIKKIPQIRQTLAMPNLAIPDFVVYSNMLLGTYVCTHMYCLYCSSTEYAAVIENSLATGCKHIRTYILHIPTE